MAGRYRASGPASVTTKTGGSAASKPSGRRSAGVATFGGTQLTADGITRDAMGSSSLLGSSIPKGLTAAAFGASHAAAANTLTNNQATAQIAIADALAQLSAISVSRRFRATEQNAEAVPNSSTDMSVESPRLLAYGPGPLVAVMGMVAGDLANVVSMFGRYGYTVNRSFVPPRMDPMTHWSYWEIADATVIGDMPQSARETIAEAFSRGVTIWNSVSEIGTTPNNQPNTGVSY